MYDIVCDFSSINTSIVLKVFLLLAGYACFLGALQFVAKGTERESMAKKAVVHTSVHLGTVEDMEGLGLAVDIQVEGVDEELLKAAHEVCLRFH